MFSRDMNGNHTRYKYDKAGNLTELKELRAQRRLCLRWVKSKRLRLQQNGVL
jgi:YD repeat-containing protein